MEVSVQYLGGNKFEADARGHKVLSDQPLDNGGADEGMTPPEFLLVSLGTCAGYYAAQYLNTRKLPAEQLQVKVTAEKALRPARLASFRIEVIAPGLNETQQEGVSRAVKTCLVHNTLLGTPRVELVVNGHDAPDAIPAAA